MTILHTADWHLGQTFMQKSRKEEHQLFIHWLLEILDQEKIDVVIVAGDIFDVANPAIEAMDLYHQFLLEAYKQNIDVIIIGGNHDSAARLNTTGDLLRLLNVHVVGGEVDALGKIIPLVNKKNNLTEAVVVAVPYLRDGEIRKIAEGEEVIEAHHQFSASVQKHYDGLLKEASEKFPGVPIIGTAHLYVNGSALSDPAIENMHAIGTLGQLSSSAFSKGYAYIAMGHIHKPQIMKHGEGVIVKYAGSPIPLSFSEREDQKEVTVLELSANQLTTRTINIPLFRPLRRFKGTPEKVTKIIEEYQHNTLLPAWGEIILTEKMNFIEFNQQIATFCIDNKIEILNRQLAIPSTTYNSIREEYIAGADNNPLDNVTEIFKLKCEKSGLNDENTNALLPLFENILTQVNEIK